VYQLAAYVVMDDHVHALLTPIAGYELKAILHSLKVVHRPSGAAASKRFGRVWQDESSDRIVRDDGEFTKSLITLSEIPGSAGLRSGTTPGSGRWTDERLEKVARAKMLAHL